MHVIELGEPAQRYWYLGIGIAALGYLYRATGDARYLEGADTVFDAAMSCRPGSLGDLTSAKVGWGSAVLYSLTGDGRHADAARRVAEMLVATQEPNGVWLRRPEITRFEDQPLGDFARHELGAGLLAVRDRPLSWLRAASRAEYQPVDPYAPILYPAFKRASGSSLLRPTVQSLPIPSRFRRSVVISELFITVMSSCPFRALATRDLYKVAARAGGR